MKSRSILFAVVLMLGALLARAVASGETGYQGASWTCQDGTSGSSDNQCRGPKAMKAVQADAAKFCQNKCDPTSHKCGVLKYTVGPECTLPAH